MQDLHERIFTCIDCSENFAWTVGEQQYLNDLLEKGYIKTVFEPQRCKRCRKARKAERQA